MAYTAYYRYACGHILPDIEATLKQNRYTCSHVVVIESNGASSSMTAGHHKICVYQSYPFVVHSGRIMSQNCIFVPTLTSTIPPDSAYLDKSKWGYQGSLSNDVWDFSSFGHQGMNEDLAYYDIVFANHDILNIDDGTVYFAANNHVKEAIIAETPKITKDLPIFGSVTCEKGAAVDTLAIEASVSDGGTLTYQWYRSGILIEGATDPEYTPTADTVGTFTYCCKVTNTIVYDLTAFAYSRGFKVVVTEEGTGGNGGGWDTDDPYAPVKSAYMAGLAAGAAMYSGTILTGSSKVTLPGATSGDPSGTYQRAFRAGFFTGLAVYGHAVERVLPPFDGDDEWPIEWSASAVANNPTLTIDASATVRKVSNITIDAATMGVIGVELIATFEGGSNSFEVVHLYAQDNGAVSFGMYGLDLGATFYIYLLSCFEPGEYDGLTIPEAGLYYGFFDSSFSDYSEEGIEFSFKLTQPST